MSEYIFDMECDGLRNEATTIHCIVLKDIETGEVHQFHSDTLIHGVNKLTRANQLIGHNIIDYDIPVLRKLLDFTTGAKILDTYKLSQLLQPERYGGHGLEAWGKRIGKHKPEHEDWSIFSQAMLHRCTEDVQINHEVYNILMQEAWEEITGVPYDRIFR